MIHRYHHFPDALTFDNFSVYITETTIDRNMLLFNYIEIYVYQRLNYGVRTEWIYI